MTNQTENAIKILQRSFATIAEATEYNPQTNLFGRPDAVLCGIAQDLHSAWECLAASIDLDVNTQPELLLTNLVNAR